MAHPLILYGYEITIPSTSISSFIYSMYDISDIIEKPFQIVCIRSFDSNQLQLILGFRPHDDLSDIYMISKNLRSYINDSPIFNDIEISLRPGFHVGVEWSPDSDEEDSEEEEDEEEDSEEDEEEEDEDEDEDEDEEEEEEDIEEDEEEDKY